MDSLCKYGLFMPTELWFLTAHPQQAHTMWSRCNLSWATYLWIHYWANPHKSSLLNWHLLTCFDYKLYGSGLLKPNHHFVTHVGACVCNFGPLHDFWTFLFEWLNKLLKSYKTNNHANGTLETTFFRQFHRTCKLRRLVSCFIVDVSSN
jgi:hypothetical protein